jgi:hypothetical protein
MAHSPPPQILLLANIYSYNYPRNRHYRHNQINSATKCLPEHTAGHNMSVNFKKSSITLSPRHRQLILSGG